MEDFDRLGYKLFKQVDYLKEEVLQMSEVE